MQNNLSHQMQERLNKFRAKVKVQEPMPKSRIPSYVARRNDWGDDDMDYHTKDQLKWNKERENNPTLYGR